MSRAWRYQDRHEFRSMALQNIFSASNAISYQLGTTINTLFIEYLRVLYTLDKNSGHSNVHKL